MGFDLSLSLPVHLLIHFSLAILSALFFAFAFKQFYWPILAGLLGGFFIDLDHVLEYFFVFGLKFNLYEFLNGYQFLTSDKIWLVFHAWEYFPIILLLVYLLRKKKVLALFLLTLAFSGLVHLVSDSYINNYPLKNYSIIYRAYKNFSAPELLRPHQWELNLKAKERLGLEK